jgi:hypothetical protein
MKKHEAEHEKQSLGQRTFRARLTLGAQLGERLSQEAFGAMIAVRMGRSRPITGATVSRWEADEALPDIPTVRAIAALCRVDPGWLAFGASTSALGPDEERRRVVQGIREASERNLARTRATAAQALQEASKRDGERLDQLTSELRALEGQSGPEVRRRQRQIVRELDTPFPALDSYDRTRRGGEEEPERKEARRRDLDEEAEDTDEQEPA